MKLIISDCVRQVKSVISQIIKTFSSKQQLKRHLSTSLYKNAYYLMFGTIITSVLGFVFLTVITRCYTPEAVGLGTAIISASGLLAIFSELGLGIGLIRFLPDAGKNGNDIINTCFTLSGLVSIIISLVFIAGLCIWLPALLPVRENLYFTGIFVFIVAVTTIQPMTLNIFMAKRDTRYIVLMNSVSGIIKIAFAAAFSIFFNTGFAIFIYPGLGLSVALLLALLLCLPKVQDGYRPIPKLNRRVLSDLSRYSHGNYIARIFLLMTPLILPLMVVSVLGEELNAYFYVALAVSNTFCVIPTSIFNSLFAEGSNDENSLHLNIAKSFKLMLLLLVPVTLLVLIVAGKFLLLFGQPYSENGTLLLRILILSVFPWGINYLYVSIDRVKKKITGVIIVTAIAAFLSLGLSYLLMQSMGLVGAGLGYLAGQTIVAMVAGFYLLRDYRRQT